MDKGSSRNGGPRRLIELRGCLRCPTDEHRGRRAGSYRSGA